MVKGETGLGTLLCLAANTYGRIQPYIDINNNLGMLYIEKNFLMLRFCVKTFIHNFSSLSISKCKDKKFFSKPQLSILKYLIVMH